MMYLLIFDHSLFANVWKQCINWVGRGHVELCLDILSYLKVTNKFNPIPVLSMTFSKAPSVFKSKSSTDSEVTFKSKAKIFGTSGEPHFGQCHSGC